MHNASESFSLYYNVQRKMLRRNIKPTKGGTMRETKTLEFKESVTKTFLKTVSAFANYGTGSILFGVDDSGAAVGLADPSSDALRIENMINDSLDPVPRYTLNIDEANKTVCLSVSEGKSKPYYCNRKAYRRADSATVEVDRIELGRLVLEGQNLSFDELPSSQADLSFSLLSEQFMRHLGLTAFDDNSLRTLGLLGIDGTYTIAGEILADSNGLSGIDIVKFGENINELLDRKTVKGRSALEQYGAALEMYERYLVYETVSQVVRRRVERVPFEAFREAVANALVHRAWDVPSDVTVSIHDDRVSVVSPGGLPSGVTEEEYLGGGISIPRNPVIANIFFRLDYIEQFGTGIARINEAYEESAVKPTFEIRENSIAVTLPFEVARPEGITLGEHKVMGEMSRNILMTRAELELRSGYSKDKTTRILNSLVSRGLVVKEGSGRGTRYRKA